MAGHLKLYLFGDQTFNVSPHLQKQARTTDNLYLQDLFTNAYDAIRVELYKLPPELREALPRSTCLADLALWYPDGKRSIALDMALTTLYHLATFVR